MAWWKDPQQLMQAMAKLVDKPTGVAGGKAKGKGTKGTGKGSDTSQKGTAKGGGKGAEGFWECPDERCHAACGKVWRNKNSLGMCGQCYEPRPGSATVDKGAIKQLRSQKLLAQEKTEVVPATDPATVTVEIKPKDQQGGWQASLDSEGEGETATTTICLPEECVQLASKLQLPWELAEDWTEEEAFAKYLPKQTKTGVDQLRTELNKLRSLKALQLEKIAQGSAEATAKKISAVEKKINSHGTEEEGASLAACELELGKKNYLLAESARLARANSGEENAQEHADRIEEICMEQMAAWEEHLATVRAERTVREAAWLSRRTMLTQRDLDVVALANSKIAEARQRAGEDEPMHEDDKLSKAKKDLEDFKEQATTAAKLAAEVAKQEKDSLLTRLEALEKRMASAAAPPDPAAQGTARLANDVYDRCHLTVVYEESELPQLTAPPDKEASRHMAVLYSNLTHWGQAGMSPLTFGQLLAGTPDGQVEAAFQLVRNVAGTQIWSRFFGGATLLTEEYVPYQLGTILNATLQKADAVLKKCNKQHDVALVSKNYFVEHKTADDALKRQRTGPYAA